MAPRALTVRLSPKAERALNALSRRRGQTRSDIVREAIEHYAAGGETEAMSQGPYQQWADIIGVVRTGGLKPGKTTGELFTEVVARKARARRSR
jgi:hypothetical protein